MKAPALELNKAHWPVRVLGPGKRIGLWVQGCSIGCKGCVSQDTWPRDRSKAVEVADLLAWCREVTQGALDGVTISGGEPFEQPQALAALLDGLARWREEAQLDFDILCYSGFPLRTLERDHAALLARLDALIPEPFAERRPRGGVWRGSDNQPLRLLSERGRARYASLADSQGDSDGKVMQVSVEAGRVWMIGIPARGDMVRLEALCKARGMELKHVSWRR